MFRTGGVTVTATVSSPHTLSNHATRPILCSRPLSVWCCRVYCVAARGPNLLVSAGCGVTVHDLATGQAIRYVCGTHVDRTEPDQTGVYPDLWLCRAWLSCCVGCFNTLPSPHGAGWPPPLLQPWYTRPPPAFPNAGPSELKLHSTFGAWVQGCLSCTLRSQVVRARMQDSFITSHTCQSRHTLV